MQVEVIDNSRIDHKLQALPFDATEPSPLLYLVHQTTRTSARTPRALKIAITA